MSETSPSDRDLHALITAKTQSYQEQLEKVAHAHNVELDNERKRYFGGVAHKLAQIDTLDNPQYKRERELDLLVSFSTLHTPEPVIATVLKCYPIQPAAQEELQLFRKITDERDITERKDAINHEIQAELAKAEVGMPEDEAINESEHQLFLRQLTYNCYELRHKTNQPHSQTHINNVLENLALSIDTTHPQRSILLRIAQTLLSR